MLFTSLIAFFSIIFLLILHEFGHFIIAKKFKVKVEEFGIGYPPRIIGKKFGETLYSLNFLPFGAFVKIYGEEGGVKDARSFTGKPIWQRALIILGGVVAFWIISWILLSITFGLGTPVAVSDQDDQGLINPKVQIIGVFPDSPAQVAGLEIGDTIKKVQSSRFEVQSVDKVKEVQEFTNEHLGEEIVLTIQRGKEVFEVPIVPRLSPPEEEGAMGVMLARTVIKSYPWYQAPFKGILETGSLTFFALKGWERIIFNLIKGKGMPAGAQIMGPVGIFSLLTKAQYLGVSYFLRFIAIISIFLALFNILPIPAVDGGRLLFLAIEKVRKKPIPQKIEQGINSAFFILLVGLMIFVTFKDIQRMF